MSTSAASTAKKRDPYRFPLAGPTAFLSTLARLLHPVRHAVWALIPGVLFAGSALLHHHADFSADLKRYMSSASYVSHLVVSIFLIGLLSRIAFGTVLCGHGLVIRSFGITLRYGFMPRFYIDPDAEDVWQLPRHARLHAYATPLLAKLALFTLGTFLWIGARPSGTLLADLGLILSQFALAAFLFTANPLWPSSSGSRLLASVLDRRNLQSGGLRLLEMMLSRRPLPATLQSGTKWGLLLFGAGVLIYFIAVVAICLFYLGAYLEQRYQGTGVVMFLAIVAAFLLWFWSTRLSRLWSRKQATGESVRATQSRAHETEQVDLALPEEQQGFDSLYGDPISRPPSWKRWLGWAIALCVIGIIAILPYNYEAGGNFIVNPSARAEVRASVDGIVRQVLVREGDWVEAGGVLAYLASDDEVKALDQAKADLFKAESDLKVLEHGAKDEAVQVAQKQVEQAEVNVKHSKIEAERYAQLLKQDAVPEALAAEMEAKYQADLATLAVARSNLVLVKSMALEDELNAARALVNRQTAEVLFRNQALAWTTITTPAAGRVVTPNLHLLLGTYLQVGQLFAELQDNRVASVEIRVPETEIDVVKPGATTRLRAWSNWGRTDIGVVVGIAPKTEEDAYGQVVRVLTDVPNGDGYLKSGMTGFGKVAGTQMPTIEAFTRMIQRFFQIEVWSWIP
jgi:multidrug resistance efflux pump